MLARAHSSTFHRPSGCQLVDDDDYAGWTQSIPVRGTRYEPLAFPIANDRCLRRQKSFVAFHLNRVRKAKIQAIDTKQRRKKKVFIGDSES